MQRMTLFLGQLVHRCPAIRSIWTIGHGTGGEILESAGPFGWDLVAFADKPTLQRLRGALDLHRADVRLRVVVDGDRFEVAWGGPHAPGSLLQWDWCQPTKTEAYYSEARWAGAPEAGNVERMRRRAVCVWQSAAAPSGRYAFASLGP